MNEHIVFFDSECPLCHRAVRHLIKIDQHKHILFAPLTGESASNILMGPLKKYRKSNSLVLIENYRSTNRKFWIRSKATTRIYWLIGTRWKFLGLLSFLPTKVGDLLYKKLAKHRHEFKLKMVDHSADSSRFLP